MALLQPLYLYPPPTEQCDRNLMRGKRQFLEEFEILKHAVSSISHLQLNPPGQDSPVTQTHDLTNIIE